MSSILNLDEVARAQTGPRDLKDPRSREYAIQTLYHFRRVLEGLKCDQAEVQRELGQMKQYEHWHVLGYPSLESMFDAELGELSELGKRNAKAAGIRLRVKHAIDVEGKTQKETADELGTTQGEVSRVYWGTQYQNRSERVRLHPDPVRAAQTIIKARGLDYARELANAILQTGS